MSPSTIQFRRSACSDSAGRHGGTLIQLLIVIGIVALLLAVLLPMASRMRAASRELQCLSNLRSISTAFRLYASDHGGFLPNPEETQVPWERSLLKYCDPAVFVCPGDEELSPFTNSSYDWRDTSSDDATLAGRRLSNSRGDAVLVHDALPGWHVDGMMNVAFVDGSASAMTTDGCVADLARRVAASEPGAAMRSGRTAP